MTPFFTFVVAIEKTKKAKKEKVTLYKKKKSIIGEEK